MQFSNPWKRSEKQICLNNCQFSIKFEVCTQTTYDFERLKAFIKFYFQSFFFRQAKDRYFYDGAESLKGYPTSEFDMEMKQTDDRHSDIMGPTRY